MVQLSIATLSSFLLQGHPHEGCGAVAASQIIMIGALIAIFYFLLIRPQQKKAKLHQEMLRSLKKGDKIYTTGGLMGTISGVSDRFVTVEIAEKVRVRILRSNIAGKEEEAVVEAKKGEAAK